MIADPRFTKEADGAALRLLAIPNRRPAEPMEIAHAALWLAPTTRPS